MWCKIIPGLIKLKYMNVINYLGWEMCLPRQNSSLRPIEGKQVDQNDLNFIQCWKLRVRFSKLSKRFQLRITFLASWLHPLEHCSDFSYSLTVFSYCNTTGKYSNSILFGLSPFLLNIKYFSQNKKLQKLLLCYCPPYHSDSILSILLKVHDSFHSSCIYSLPCIKNSDTTLLLWLWKNSISDILNKDSRLWNIFFFFT